MKKLSITVLFLFVLSCSVVSAMAGYELPVSGSARISLAEGSVVAKVDANETKLETGDSIDAPASVEVSAGARLELLLPDGSVLRFSEGTQFTLVKSSVGEANRQVEVDVAMGDCWASVKEFLGDTDFEVNSPTAVAGVAGTKYRLNVSPDDASMYRVYNGKVRVKRRWKAEGYEGKRVKVSGPQRVAGPSRVSEEKWLEILSAGYQFNIRADGRYDSPKKFDEKKDKESPWVKWNMERDSKLGI